MIATLGNLHKVAEGLTTLKGERVTVADFLTLIPDATADQAAHYLEWARNRESVVRWQQENLMEGCETNA